MLKLIQTEFLKLRRRKLIWLMLLSALIMPFFALLYFNYFGKTGVEPIKFYKCIWLYTLDYFACCFGYILHHAYTRRKPV